MANYLLLNQNQVWNGLGTLTYTVPAGTATQAYNVQVQTTFPAAVPISTSNAGSGKGLGAGTGGGGEGFTKGDQGAGEGGVGQGFGTGNNYQQPPSAASNVTASNPVTSGLVIVVEKNAVTQYTATTPAVFQSALQFKVSLPGVAAGDSITVVLSSAVSSDNQLSGVTSNISVGQGL